MSDLIPEEFKWFILAAIVFVVASIFGIGILIGKLL